MAEADRGVTLLQPENAEVTATSRSYEQTRKGPTPSLSGRVALPTPSLCISGPHSCETIDFHG